ncbi:MAG: hypothetical protein J6I53_11195 [Treponema sp.]|nr:hypothetical protein [Treponema sp.]
MFLGASAASGGQAFRTSLSAHRPHFVAVGCYTGAPRLCAEFQKIAAWRRHKLADRENFLKENSRHDTDVASYGMSELVQGFCRRG